MEEENLYFEEIIEETMINKIHWYYAQINEDNICTVVSDLSGEIIAPHMIEIPDYDISYLGKIYTEEGWIENPQPLNFEEPQNEIIEERVSSLEQKMNNIEGMLSQILDKLS